MAFGKSDKEPEKGIPSVSGYSPASVENPGGKMEVFLGKGSKVVGTLSFTGPVELDGFIEGEVNAQDRLTIGEAAVINAKINGAEILIKGTVTGDIFASKRLALRKPAKVTGNITSANLSIEEGVIFEGKCAMSSAAASSGAASSGAATAARSSENKI